MKIRLGELNPKAKLTVDDVLSIRASQEPQLVLAKRYGVGPDTIWSIRARQTWAHVPDARANSDDPLERWRTVTKPGYAHYEVSDLGRLRRAATNLPQPPRKYRVSPLGYAVYVLSKGNKQVKVSAHRLVALAFLGPCPSGKQVNHKDGNKLNNRLSNLEYVTAKENILHAVHVLGCRLGQRNGRAKLTRDQAIAIKGETNATEMQMALRYGVAKSTIARIRQGKSWRHDVSTRST